MKKVLRKFRLLATTTAVGTISVSADCTRDFDGTPNARTDEENPSNCLLGVRAGLSSFEAAIEALGKPDDDAADI